MFWSKKEPHTHTIERRIGVTHYDIGKSYSETIVLCRCACGKVFTERLYGTWSLEQLNG